MNFAHKILMAVLICSILGAQDRPLVLVLDPAGDAACPGRILGDTYERSSTFQLANEIKRILKQHEPRIACFISRAPGQVLEPLEQIQLANRLPADLFIRLQCYHTQGSEQYCHFFYLMRHPITDLWHTASKDSLQFIPLESAHQPHLKQTQEIVENVANFLKPLAAHAGFFVHLPLGIPCLHLQGLMMPGCIIELGISHQGEWRSIAYPLAQAIRKVLLTMIQA